MKTQKKDAFKERPKKASFVKKINNNILPQKQENKKLSKKELLELDKTLKRLKKYMKEG